MLISLGISYALFISVFHTENISNARGIGFNPFSPQMAEERLK